MLLNHDVIKAIYHDVVNHCKERVPHFKLLVLGDVATGKTSLVRTLSGKEFCAERHATDGSYQFFVNSYCHLHIISSSFIFLCVDQENLIKAILVVWTSLIIQLSNHQTKEWNGIKMFVLEYCGLGSPCGVVNWTCGPLIRKHVFVNRVYLIIECWSPKLASIEYPKEHKVANKSGNYSSCKKACTSPFHSIIFMMLLISVLLCPSYNSKKTSLLQNCGPVAISYLGVDPL